MAEETGTTTGRPDPGPLAELRALAAAEAEARERWRAAEGRELRTAGDAFRLAEAGFERALRRHAPWLLARAGEADRLEAEVARLRAAPACHADAPIDDPGALAEPDA